MEPLLTQILKELKTDLSGTIDLLQPVAIQLLLWFFLYELTTGLLFSKPSENPLIIFKNKFTTWLFLYSIIYYFKKIIKLIENIFSYFTKVSIKGGLTIDLEELPYRVLVNAISVLKNILNYIQISKPQTWILLFGVILGLFVFAKVCLAIGMVIIEYLVMSSLVIILVPFMMFEKLRFVGDKVIGTLINLNMKIFIIQYLMFYFSRFLAQPINLPDEATGGQVLESGFYWLVAMAILGMMTMKGHEMAQTLINGATTFGDSSELVAMARQGGSKLISGVNRSLKGVAGGVAGAKNGGSEGGLKAGGIGATIGATMGAIKGTANGLRGK